MLYTLNSNDSQNVSFEIMNLLIQHEYYQEVLQAESDLDTVERGARGENVENEKCYTEEDMWRVHEG